MRPMMRWLAPVLLLSLSPACGSDPVPAPWVVTSNPTGGSDALYGLAVDADSVYGVGESRDASNHDVWRIEKRSKSDGTLVATFGVGGAVTANPYAFAMAAAVGSDGLYVVGGALIGAYPGWRIEKRALSDGAYVPAFGVGGGVDVNLGTTNNGRPVRVLVAPDALYVGGSDSAGSDARWRVEKRDLVTGALVTGFGTGGVLSINPTSAGDGLADLTIVGDSLYLFGSETLPGPVRGWRVEKHLTADGALVAGFGTGGVVETRLTINDAALAMAADATSLYLTGYDVAAAGGLEWRVEKRGLADGALDPGFGAGGIVRIDPSIEPGTSFEQPNAIAVDAGNLYVLGIDDTLGFPNARWRLEERSAATGALVPAFADGGVYTVDPTPAMDVPAAMVVDAMAITLGGYENGADQAWRIERLVK